jgi:hypothetical protein
MVKFDKMGVNSNSRGCGVVVSTSEHHAGGMGSNPTPRK